MLGWTVLKFWIAVCWKMSWKLDPLPLSVPLSLAPLAAADAVPVDVPVAVVVGELDEEQAARATAKMASPAVVTCRLGRRCISGTPYRVYRVGPQRAARSSCKPWCASTVCRRCWYLRVNERWTK